MIQIASEVLSTATSMQEMMILEATSLDNFRIPSVLNELHQGNRTFDNACLYSRMSTLFKSLVEGFLSMSFGLIILISHFSIGEDEHHHQTD